MSLLKDDLWNEIKKVKGLTPKQKKEIKEIIDGMIGDH